MNIKVEWCENGNRGWLEYDADVLIKDMPMLKYKTLMKLFARNATPEQRNAVLTRIKTLYQEAYDWLNLKLSLKDDREVKRTKDIMKKYNRKYEILLGLIQ